MTRKTAPVPPEDDFVILDQPEYNRKVLARAKHLANPKHLRLYAITGYPKQDQSIRQDAWKREMEFEGDGGPSASPIA